MDQNNQEQQKKKRAGVTVTQASDAIAVQF